MWIDDAAGEHVKRLKGRYFNSVLYDASNGTVTKTSSDEEKLRNEIRWYLQLPKDLRPIIPRIESYSLVAGATPHVSLEYIPSQTIGDRLVNGDFRSREWGIILDQIRDLLQRFAAYPGPADSEQTYEMYILKTETRLSSTLGHNESIRKFHHRGDYYLNGKKVVCPIRNFHKHKSFIQRYLAQPLSVILHGDLCFSNLFYLPTGDIKAIDPRGSFGSRGIYGDQRYDMAKVRHSISGYEHIVRNQFSVRTSDILIDIVIGAEAFRRQLRDEWDKRLDQELRYVKLIEALLFLSMLPLHRDDPSRQLAFYALATELLMEAISD